ncbi:hypothetical protein Goklo_004775 [Gossypium klotzschianum]|uniref:Uncharacterized protein n=1 Tax=Gossypium klotzschianum TaxID=34286 RepID=A0A7J8VPY0_9ROSI|nr:hypothetical protein [Gossypium klotzschianum]
MALKTLMLVCLLVAAMAFIPPIAEAQLGGLISGLLGLIRIQGTVFCTVDGNMGVNGTATPVFPLWWKRGFEFNNKWIWHILHIIRSIAIPCPFIDQQLQLSRKNSALQLQHLPSISGDCLQPYKSSEAPLLDS